MSVEGFPIVLSEVTVFPMAAATREQADKRTGEVAFHVEVNVMVAGGSKAVAMRLTLPGAVSDLALMMPHRLTGRAWIDGWSGKDTYGVNWTVKAEGLTPVDGSVPAKKSVGA
ncbi:hypothetical protein [Streptomyces sp. SID3343]|uniref:hypothetical protein n=1 Tax=Streptomyces sp. SID3343 TaxID=2690260 RepID=UPI00136A844D|nr:hypothetical protein [Streptomyces sp. SID3343]MYW00708.1 hypothetical protein [Streptomyces sp. SID3343]